MKPPYRARIAGSVAIALLLFARAVPAQEPYPGLDAYIAKSLQTLKVPGAAVAIVRNDSIIYAKGFGVLALGSTAPVTDQTLFEIGSSTKAFTATLVAMMVSDNKMRYDDLMSQYLPDFRLFDPAASAQVTLRDALTHRSGIARGELVWLDAGESREDVLHRVRFLKPDATFRSRWIYQNIMYLAAGEAAAKAAHTTWEDLLQQRILSPLGMTSTAPLARLLKDKSNLATPHGLDHDTVYVQGPFQAEDIAPAGSIISNVRDMAQWLRFQLNDGMVNGKRLVSTAALRETHTPQMIMGPGSGAGGPNTLFNTYGMGWMVQDYRHELMWQHGGNTPGMTAAVGMLPEKKFGVVVLSSMDHTPLSAGVMNYIFDRHLGAPVRDYIGETASRVMAQARPVDSTTHVAAAAPLPLSAYVGTYADSLYGEATVTIKDGHLEFARGRAHGPLEYWNANNFRWTSNSSIRGLVSYIKFEVTPDNKVTGVYFGYGSEINLLGRKFGTGAGR
jgi:CubicO group peptidase (beta-lactamase class C family)